MIRRRDTLEDREAFVDNFNYDAVAFIDKGLSQDIKKYVQGLKNNEKGRKIIDILGKKKYSKEFPKQTSPSVKKEPARSKKGSKPAPAKTPSAAVEKAPALAQKKESVSVPQTIAPPISDFTEKSLETLRFLSDETKALHNLLTEMSGALGRIEEKNQKSERRLEKIEESTADNDFLKKRLAESEKALQAKTADCASKDAEIREYREANEILKKMADCEVNTLKKKLGEDFRKKYFIFQSLNAESDPKFLCKAIEDLFEILDNHKIVYK